MEPQESKSDGILLPVLYVLLAIAGVFTAAAVAGIVWFCLHPAAVAARDVPEEQVQAAEPVTPGPRTMISTYSVRARERGWDTQEPAASPSQMVPETQREDAGTVPEAESVQPVQEPAEAPPTSEPPVSTSGTQNAAIPENAQAQNNQGGNTAPSSDNTGRNQPSTSETWGDDSTTNEITGRLTKTAYWVAGGKSYHFSSSCPSLSRSKNIQTGTLQEALNAGKTDPCNNCAGGS